MKYIYNLYTLDSKLEQNFTAKCKNYMYIPNSVKIVIVDKLYPCIWNSLIVRTALDTVYM